MLSTILLQITTAAQDTANAMVPTAETTQQSLSLWQLIVKGGPVMYFIGLLSVGLVYLFLERWMIVRKAMKSDKDFMSNIKNAIAGNNLDVARSLAKNNATPVGRMIEKGLNRLGKPIKEIESAMENTGKVELSKVEKNVGYLSTIAAIAPMFGFVGTIFGVITIFYNISLTGDFGIQTISGGLYQKMVTSAAGLIIGIMAFIAHHILANMIERLVAKMEVASLEFIDILSEPSK